MCFFFFFSSRRRHTRCGRDWSSDVCSSDLLEQLDQPAGVALADIALSADSVKPEKGFSDSFEKDLLDGVVVLHREGVAVHASDARRALYFPSSAAAGRTTKVPLTFIPYYAWANRAPSAMVVWTPLLKS